MTCLPSTLRRRLLKVTGAFFLVQMVGLGSAVAASAPTIQERTTLAAFLNVLLPRDAHSGSATDLRVDTKLWEFSQSSSQFRRLVQLGCQWLNLTGGPPFADLQKEQQIAIVEWMAASDWNEVPRRFYELLRQVAAEVYYSDPAAWNGLAIRQPPQPIGYPPPWQ